MTDAVEIYVDFGDGGTGSEWVVPLGDGKFRLAGNPYYPHRRALVLGIGDVVELAPLQDGPAHTYKYVRRVERSSLRRTGHWLGREILAHADWDAFDRVISAAGGQWERAFGGILTLNLPRGGALDGEGAYHLLAESVAGRAADTEAALRRDVDHLAVSIGERHLGKPDRLRQAADWLAANLADAGLAVTRLPFQVDGQTVENLEAVLPGTTLPDEIVVVGAHYDTVWQTPGADDNATGVAALLLIARDLAGRPRARTVRFVAFVNEEPPYFHTEAMGSLVYARACKARGDRIVGMISLESLGYYADEPGTQRYPDPALAERFGDRGNFLALVADPSSADLLNEVGRAFRSTTGAPTLAREHVGDAQGLGWSDHWSFWQVGYPAVLATDTVPFRNPHYHQPTDLPQTLDFPRLATAAVGLRGAVEALADPDQSRV